MTRNNPKLLISFAVLVSLALACSLSGAYPTASESGQEVAPEATATSEPLGLPEKEETTASPGATTAAEPTPTEEAIPAASIPDANAYSWVEVASGFRQPLYLTPAGDGSGRLFVVGQAGTIWVIENGQVLATPFLDIRGRVGSQGNEQGLLGLAFHPNYAENGFFYVDYTDLNGDTVVSRFSVSADANQADVNSESILLQVNQPYANHNGGNILFGPDGYLYIGLGDGGSAGDPRGNAQSRDTLLGKILRIDVDGGAPYAIPPDNPFATGGGLPEIWTYGLRNPWRFSFDSLTEDLYIADVGQNIWEEVDFTPAGTGAGANFGWDYYEGNHAYEGSAPAGLSVVFPVAEYDHSGRCSITGGYVYRGSELPAWNGVYLYADYCSGEIFGLARGGDGQWQNELVYDLDELITSFGQDGAGELYFLGRNGGVFKLTAN